MTTKFPVSSDTNLWDDFRSGDDQAFEVIYNTYVEVLFRYGSKFTSNDHLVKDCIQELFIDIYDNRKNLGQTNNIKFYLIKSLKRRIIKNLKAIGLHSSLNEVDSQFLVAYSQNDDLFNDDLTDQKKELIKKALNELTPRQKEAIYLRYTTCLSYEEICEIMNMNYQSVRNIVFRAIEKMRSVISQTNMILLLLLKRL